MSSYPCDQCEGFYPASEFGDNNQICKRCTNPVRSEPTPEAPDPPPRPHSDTGLICHGCDKAVTGTSTCGKRHLCLSCVDAHWKEYDFLEQRRECVGCKSHIPADDTYSFYNFCGDCVPVDAGESVRIQKVAEVLRSQQPHGIPPPASLTNKYQRVLGANTVIDVYDVLKAYQITCPALAHAIKKCLMLGERGAKDSETDLREAIVSIKRSIEMGGSE